MRKPRGFESLTRYVESSVNFTEDFFIYKFIHYWQESGFIAENVSLSLIMKFIFYI